MWSSRYCMRAIITLVGIIFTPYLKAKKFFIERFFVKFWPYVWLVLKSGFKSRAGYSGARMVLQNWTLCTNYRFHIKAGTNNQFQSISKQQWHKSNTSWKNSPKETNMLVCKIQLLFCYIFLLHIQIVKMQISNTTATYIFFFYIFALHCFYSLFTWTKDE